MKLHLNAKNLRIVLIAGMILIMAGAVMGFILARNELQKFATSISQMEANAASVDNDVATLKQLQTTLKANQDIKDKANAIAVPSSDYPVKVIANVTEIANKAGIKLTSINYGNETSAAPGNTGAAQTTPAGGTTTSPPAPNTTDTTGVATPSGFTKKTINVSTEPSVDYNALMSFIKGIETDDMFLHITRLSLAKGVDGSVTVQPFTIEVYIR